MNEEKNRQPDRPEGELPAVLEETEVAEAQDAEAVDNTVFGMPRLMFYLMVVGYAMGAIVTGLSGILGFTDGSSTVLPGTVGAVLGYFLFKYLEKRTKAGRRTKR